VKIEKQEYIMRFLLVSNVKIYCNMDNIFLVAGIVSVIFFIAKFLEMRYVDNEPKALKYLVRDTLLVYISVISGCFVIEQLTPVIENTTSTNATLVFTDNPPF
jgi:hypothetical protein